jgi:hypothetical protein
MMPPLQAEEAVKEAVIRLCFMPKAFQGRCADKGPTARSDAHDGTGLIRRR